MDSLFTGVHGKHGREGDRKRVVKNRPFYVEQNPVENHQLRLSRLFMDEKFVNKSILEKVKKTRTKMWFEILQDNI